MAVGPQASESASAAHETNPLASSKKIDSHGMIQHYHDVWKRQLELSKAESEASLAHASLLTPTLRETSQL